MSNLKIRIIFIVIAGLFIMFFSNDFGIIDIKKTAIITAVGIDKEEDEYVLTVQIAMPKDKNSSAKNEKSAVSAKGATVSGALNKIGSLTGWDPKLSFCNLIILGKELLNENVINAVNYFTKTLSVQDSTLIAASEGKAADIINANSPLDDLSSFSVQKILLKKTGLTKDVMKTDIKTFSIGYYGKAGYSFLPLIKTVESEDKKSVFDATDTVLLKNGKKVAVLTGEETFAVNLMSDVANSLMSVEDVNYKNENFGVLLDILSVKKELKLYFENDKPKVLIKADIFVKIEDQNSVSTDLNLHEKTFVPKAICKKAEEDVVSRLESVVEKSKTYGADVFGLTDKLYRFNHKYYKSFKDDIIARAEYSYKINFYGQEKEP